MAVLLLANKRRCLPMGATPFLLLLVLSVIQQMPLPFRMTSSSSTTTDRSMSSMTSMPMIVAVQAQESQNGEEADEISSQPVHPSVLYVMEGEGEGRSSASLESLYPEMQGRSSNTFGGSSEEAVEEEGEEEEFEGEEGEELEGEEGEELEGEEGEKMKGLEDEEEGEEQQDGLGEEEGEFEDEGEDRLDQLGLGLQEQPEEGGPPPPTNSLYPEVGTNVQQMVPPSTSAQFEQPQYQLETQSQQQPQPQPQYYGNSGQGPPPQQMQYGGMMQQGGPMEGGAPVATNTMPMNDNGYSNTVGNDNMNTNMNPMAATSSNQLGGEGLDNMDQGWLGAPEENQGAQPQPYYTPNTETTFSSSIIQNGADIPPSDEGLQSQFDAAGIQTGQTPNLRGAPMPQQQQDPPQLQSLQSSPALNAPQKDMSCPLPPPKTTYIAQPTMIASYPGSGAKLTWKLIRGFTGYMTSDDAVDHNDLSKNSLVIAIKTHYPARGSNDALFAPYERVPKSVLLIRNPLNALPSFHSFIYEQSLQLTGHSVRAPVNMWVTWRDKHFFDEMDLWVKHTRYWMEHHDYEHRLVLPYDYLIQPGSGPTELRKLRTFLEKGYGDAGGVPEFRSPMEKIGCIWDFIVMKREDQGTDRGSMRKGGPKVWPYTNEQFQYMKEQLEKLKMDYPGQLGMLMEAYIYKINEAQTNPSIY